MEVVQELFALSCLLGPEAVTQVHPPNICNALTLLHDGDFEAAEALTVQASMPDCAAASAGPDSHGHWHHTDSITACLDCSTQVNGMGDNTLGLLHAEARVSIPWSYPNAACSCSIVSSSLSRADASTLHASLQAIAESAASEGRPWLLELPSIVQEAVQSASLKRGEHQQQQAGHQGQQGSPAVQNSYATRPAADSCSFLRPDGATANQDRRGDSLAAGMKHVSASPGEHQPSERDESFTAPAFPLRVALVRLDHMRDRSLYCRTLKAWASELGVTGRIVLPGSAAGSGGLALILLVLEGEAQDLRQFMVRHRTENVDVDSRGRKCRERMMQVVCEEPLQQRGYADFREMPCSSLQDLQAALEPSGLGSWQWARKAAGLPSCDGKA